MKKKKIVYIILFLVMLCWTILVYFNKLVFLDTLVYNFVISFKSNNMTYIMKKITFLASSKFIIFMCFIFFVYSIFKKNKRFVYYDVIVAFSIFINLIVKSIIRRDRPDKIYWLIKEKNFSFPSGHSMGAITFYGIIIYLVLSSKLDKRIKYILCGLLSTIILLIGISRVYLGVHYISDVIGGYLWGSFILISCVNYLKRSNRL